MMIDETIFDDIRPYRDEEIPAAMHRIADNDLFPLLSSFAFPDRNGPIIEIGFCISCEIVPSAMT